jgi:tetratricopeptide (TPR) repeat protein
MKYHLLPTALFGSILLVSYVKPALALSPVEVQLIAKQTTVDIAGCHQGSGVIIQKKGNTYTVLTVASAVKNSGCEIVAPDDTKYPVTQVKTFPNSVDLAVVSFTSTKNYPVAKLIDNSDRVEAAETIYISGFPLSTTLVQPVGTTIAKSLFTFAKGTVVANPSDRQQPKGYSLIYSNNTLLEDGGSPVWNDKGELIAIHGRSALDTTLPEPINADVPVKTGFKLGITVNTFAKFATAAGIDGYTPIVGAAKPTPVDDLIASAILKESKGDYRGMLADMNEAIFLDSQNSQLYYNRGVAKSMLGNRDAIEDYNRSISLNPDRADAYINRGVTKFDLGDNKGAIEDYKKAIGIDPKAAGAYYHRGNAKAALKSPKGALDDFNRALALDPRLAPAHLSRGIVKSILGDTKGELADFDRAIALNPKYTQAYYKLGLAKSKLGDNKGAIEQFDRAITLNPKDPETYNNRANAKSKLGDNKGAIEDYDRSITLNPQNARTYANRGLIKSKLGDKKGAILDLKKAADRFKLQKQTANYKRVMNSIAKIQP